MAAQFNSLTAKQKKVYSAIESYLKLKGIPPTVREIGEMVGEKTPGAVQGILNRLEQKGVIKRQVGMARSIQLVSSEDTLYAQPVYVPEIKKISTRNVDNLLSIYNIVKYQPVCPEIASPDEKFFMIRCPDNSLAAMGIKHNEMLLVNMDAQRGNGDIVIALFENHTLVRQYFRNTDDGRILLKADQDIFNKEEYDTDEVVIIGKLVAKMSVF